jgi:hypothetical protein
MTVANAIESSIVERQTGETDFTYQPPRTAQDDGGCRSRCWGRRGVRPCRRPLGFNVQTDAACKKVDTRKHKTTVSVGAAVLPARRRDLLVETEIPIISLTLRVVNVISVADAVAKRQPSAHDRRATSRRSSARRSRLVRRAILAPAVVSKTITLATAALRSDLSGAAGELDSATTAFSSGDYGDAARYDVWFRLVLAHRSGGSALWRPML